MDRKELIKRCKGDPILAADRIIELETWSIEQGKQIEKLQVQLKTEHAINKGCEAGYRKQIGELEAQNKQLADALLLELKIAETPPINSTQAKRIEKALGESDG